MDFQQNQNQQQQQHNQQQHNQQSNNNNDQRQPRRFFTYGQRREPAELTRDEVEESEKQFAAMNQRQQSGEDAAFEHGSLCEGVRGMKVFGGSPPTTHGGSTSPPGTLTGRSSPNSLAQQQGQQQGGAGGGASPISRRRGNNNGSHSTHHDSSSRRRRAFCLSDDDDEQLDAEMSEHEDARRRAMMGHQHRDPYSNNGNGGEGDFQGQQQQQNRNGDYFVPVSGHSGARRRVGGGDFNTSNSGNASQSSDFLMNGGSSGVVCLDDVAFPIPRAFFRKLSSFAQAVLRFAATRSETLNDALEHVARLYQVTVEMWTFHGKLSDSYESLSQLRPLQVDALLRFGAFTFSPCGKLIVPNATNPALVPTTAALCDSCERILQGFSESGMEEPANGGGGGNGGMFFSDDFNESNNNNFQQQQHQQFQQQSQRSTSPPAMPPNRNPQMQYQQQHQMQQQQSMAPDSHNVVGSLKMWCQYANGFGWREGRDEVQRHSHVGGLVSPDVSLFADAMLTQTGVPMVATAMRATLLQAHDRYGSGLAVMLRSSRFPHPRKAAEWHSDELLPALCDNFQHNNNNNQQQIQNQQQQPQIAGARIVPCSADGEARHVDFRNPPSLRAHAMCVVVDPAGPLLSFCFMHLPQGRRLGYDECSHVGFGFASWLGLLTVPNANQEHFLVLGLPSRVLNQQEHAQDHAQNLELVRQVWGTHLCNSGWQRIQVSEQEVQQQQQQPCMNMMSPGRGSSVMSSSSSAFGGGGGFGHQQQQQQQQQQQGASRGGFFSPSASNFGGGSEFGGGSSNGTNRFSATMANFRASQSSSSMMMHNQQSQQGRQQQRDMEAANGGNIVPSWVVFYKGKHLRRYDGAGLPRGVVQLNVRPPVPGAQQ